jgi:hypothetical protein
VIPKTGHRDYGFHVTDPDKSVRQIILSIRDHLFSEKQLKFQEAPDLCYQKMKRDLEHEEMTGPIKSRVEVTPSDVEEYRVAHPDSKARSKR